MKKQMKTSLFTAALGLALTGAMLSSATKETGATAAYANTLPVSREFSAAPAGVAVESPKLPFTFYLKLITAFTNGGFINFNQLGEEGQSFFRNEIPKWGMKQ
ncbi:MAG: hypothetical protein IPN76_11810 [Saprospiraceae bacterium]|nr:hypothetical protein [Saprospiraceae bacterium]